MSVSPRILLAIADPLLRQSVAEHLRQARGMTVTEAASAAEAAEHAAGHHLTVVDEAMDGPALCLRLHGAGTGLPLIFLGDEHAVPCRTAIGAALPKPLRLSALAARIAEMLERRSEPAERRIGPWRFDAGRAVLEGTGGSPVRLTGKEAAILARLVQADGQVVARDILLDEVWGYGAEIATHTLETHIYRLRRKLGGELLVTAEGGYRLAAGS